MSFRASADQIADHERDHRKHDWRPGDPPSFDQRAAVAKLVGYAEAIAGSGLIGEIMEAKLRERIAETLTAFNMPTLAERKHEVTVAETVPSADAYEATEARLALVMGES